jgi:hypothetical protein
MEVFIKEIEHIKKYKMKIIELIKTISKLKISVDGLTRKIEYTKNEIYNELEVRKIEITQSKKQR